MKLSYDGDSHECMLDNGPSPLSPWLACLRIAYWEEEDSKSSKGPTDGEFMTETESMKWRMEVLAWREAPFETHPCSVSRDVLAAAHDLYDDLTRCEDEDNVRPTGRSIKYNYGKAEVVRGVKVMMEEVCQTAAVNSLGDAFTGPQTKGGTSYANACAAAIFLANSRIIGRAKLSFMETQEIMIREFGENGADTGKVLGKATKSNIFGGRLRFRKVNLTKAQQILSKRKHPIVVSFPLSDGQWEMFTRFYKTVPESAMPAGYIGEQKNDDGSRKETKNHAVVATGVDESGNLILLNSWGQDGSQSGSFTLDPAALPNLQFHHVFFYERDVSKREAYDLTLSSVCREYEKERCSGSIDSLDMDQFVRNEFLNMIAHENQTYKACSEKFILKSLDAKMTDDTASESSESDLEETEATKLWEQTERVWERILHAAG